MRISHFYPIYPGKRIEGGEHNGKLAQLVYNAKLICSIQKYEQILFHEVNTRSRPRLESMDFKEFDDNPRSGYIDLKDLETLQKMEIYFDKKKVQRLPQYEALIPENKILEEKSKSCFLSKEALTKLNNKISDFLTR